jgi:O-antigen/teichoic acid export membrane protein
MADRHAELKRRTAGSVFWSLLRALVEQGFAFILFVVLARLISPHEMGLFAIALLFAEFGKLIASAGFPDAVIREPKLDEELADSMFCANMLMAAIVTALLCALAAPLAVYFREPDLRNLILGVAIVIPVSSAGGVHTGRKLREFGYRAVTTRIFIAGLVGGIVGVTAAYHGWGAWSLVLQRTVTETLLTILAWNAFRWLPRLRINWARTIDVIKFSANVMLTQATWFVSLRSQDFIIGRGLDAASVGMYRLAARANDLLVQFSVAPFVSSALPTLARLQADRAALCTAILRYNAMIGLIVCPVFMGFAVLAPEAVPTVFGARWASSAPIAQVLCGVFLAHALTSVNMPTFAALGRPGVTLRIALAQLSVGIVFTILAVPYGLLAVAISYVARVYLMLPLQIVVLKRMTGLRYVDLFTRVAPSITAALVMVAAVELLRAWLLSHFTPIAYLAIMTPFAGCLYVAALAVIAPRFARDQIKFVLALRGGGGAAGVAAAASAVDPAGESSAATAAMAAGEADTSSEAASSAAIIAGAAEIKSG